MLENLFKKPIASPITEDEANYASLAQEEIANAIAALRLVAARGCCNPKLPRQLLKVTDMLADEVTINHSLMVAFLEKIDQQTI
jgi:hypothetical protein